MKEKKRKKPKKIINIFKNGRMTKKCERQRKLKRKENSERKSKRKGNVRKK